MSSKSKQGSSPYQRGNTSARGRGMLLVITALILLVAAGAWVSNQTRAIGNGTADQNGAKVIDVQAQKLDASKNAPASR